MMIRFRRFSVPWATLVVAIIPIGHFRELWFLRAVGHVWPTARRFGGGVAVRLTVVILILTPSEAVSWKM
jgi:hypothetical protein